MPEHSNPPPSVDWTKVPFPSDRLTLGHLRQRAASDPDELEVLAYNLLSFELDVAGAVLLQYPPGSNTARVSDAIKEENCKQLAALYVEMGVASGPQEAKLLVDELIAAVRAHVRAPGGRV